MKVSTFMRCKALFTLLLLFSLVEARPQGYYYPAPANPSTTSPTPSTTSNGEATTSSPDNSTTPFNGYIIEGKEGFSALAEKSNSAIAQETTTDTLPEAHVSSSFSLEESSSTKQPEETTTQEEGKENDQTTEVQPEVNTVKDGDDDKETLEDNTKTETPEEEQTTSSNDVETTTFMDAPYPPSGLRPTGREFSYDVQDLFPGSKVSQQVVGAPSSESVSNDAGTDSSLDPRVASPDVEELREPSNLYAQQAFTTPGPRPYYYQPPPQQLRNSYFPQKPPVSRNFPSQRFVQTYPSMSYSNPAPYPPARVDYDQRFSASNFMAQSSLPSANYRQNYEQTPFEFAYDVRVAPYGPFFGHQESRRGSEAQGRYYVVQPDGRLRVVRYEAGSAGFRPSISYEATLDYQDYQ